MAEPPRRGQFKLRYKALLVGPPIASKGNLHGNTESHVPKQASMSIDAGKRSINQIRKFICNSHLDLHKLSITNIVS